MIAPLMCLSPLSRRSVLLPENEETYEIYSDSTLDAFMIQPQRQTRLKQEIHTTHTHDNKLEKPIKTNENNKLDIKYEIRDKPRKERK